jgi:hypothetical protein
VLHIGRKYPGVDTGIDDLQMKFVYHVSLHTIAVVRSISESHEFVEASNERATLSSIVAALVKIDPQLRHWIDLNWDRGCPPEQLIEGMIAQRFDPPIAKGLCVRSSTPEVPRQRNYEQIYMWIRAKAVHAFP